MSVNEHVNVNELCLLLTAT